MTTIENIMALADSYAAVSAVSTMAHAVEARAELVTALTEALAQPKQRTAGCTLCGYCAATGEKIQVAQPVREPLSDRQISKLWSDAHNDTTDRMAFQVLAKAIERAHGIGGERE